MHAINQFISQFHARLATEFAHVQNNNQLSLVDAAHLSKALALAAPTGGWPALDALGFGTVANFERELRSAQPRAEQLLARFLAPLELSARTRHELIHSVHGAQCQKGSAPARYRAGKFWTSPYVAAANRVCPAVDKVFVRSGVHGYNVFINAAYAMALELALDEGSQI